MAGRNHMLAYITPREAEFLRALDRGLSQRGEQFTYGGMLAFSHRGDVEAGTGRTVDTYRDRNRGEPETEGGTGRISGDLDTGGDSGSGARISGDLDQRTSSSDTDFSLESQFDMPSGRTPGALQQLPASGP